MKIGSIFGTGCNSAYMEDVRSIPKIQNSGLPPDTPIAINTEYGAFDNERKVLPLTRFDDEIDQQSARPGQQTYEKMVAGLYVGEILRLILVELNESGKLFSGQTISRLHEKNSINSQFLTAIEEDRTDSLADIQCLFIERLGVDLTLHERKVVQYLAELVATRSARLYSCGIAAICKKKNMEYCHVGVDGSVFDKSPAFRVRAAQALREILDWPRDSEDKVRLQFAEDGSGVGAALIASLAVERSTGIHIHE